LVKFRDWASPQGVYVFPVHYEVASLYLTYVATLTQSAPMTDRASAALRSEHRQRNLVSPTDDPGIRELMKGVANRYGQPPHSVRPLTPQLLRDLLRGLVSPRPTSLAMRTAWLALFSYQITGRCGDIKKLRAKDLTFQEDGSLTVTFRNLKNVPVKRGFRVAVHPQSGSWCPVYCTKKYLRKLRLKGRDWLLPVIYKRKRKGRIVFSVNPRAQASNAALRLHFRDALRGVGVEDATEFGLHSPRRGSTQALRDAGFSAADINYRVGWKSAGMMSLYTRDAPSVQAGLSKTLRVPE